MFFEGYSAEQLIVLLVGAIIAISQGLYPGVSILEWLKNKLGLEDFKMKLVVIAFFAGLSALAMWVTGELAVEFTLKSLLANFAIFITLAELAYQRLTVKRNGG